jgi:uncharacterized protein
VIAVAHTILMIAFQDTSQSPLTPEQQRTFQGLRYFPENPALRLVVPIEEFADQEAIVMQTSTGDVREYMRYGRLRFSVDGQAVELTLYTLRVSRSRK